MAHLSLNFNQFIKNYAQRSVILFSAREILLGFLYDPEI